MIEPKDAYDYIQSAFRNGELREEVDVLILASEDDIHIYAINDRGFVGLYVFCDGEMLDYENTSVELLSDEDEYYSIDEEMLGYALEWLYERYLGTNIGCPEEDEGYSDDDEYDGISYPEQLDLIENREEDLALAFDEFLSVISPTLYGDECVHMLNDVLALIARKYGVDIYRPMFVQTEDGDEIYTEYPYSYESDDWEYEGSYDYECDPAFARFEDG